MFADYLFHPAYSIAFHIKHNKSQILYHKSYIIYHTSYIQYPLICLRKQYPLFTGVSGKYAGAFLIGSI